MLLRRDEPYDVLVEALGGKIGLQVGVEAVGVLPLDEGFDVLVEDFLLLVGERFDEAVVSLFARLHPLSQTFQLEQPAVRRIFPAHCEQGAHETVALRRGQRRPRCAPSRSRRGRRSGPNPWGAPTLEWSIPSPPPVDHVLSREMYEELKARRGEAAAVSGGIRLSTAAAKRWHDWYILDFHRDSDTAEEDAMRPRHAPLIRKLALIYAATEGTATISVEQLDAAIAVIEWMGRNVRQMVGTWGQSPMGKLERRIREVLAQAPNQTMRRRDLQRRCQARTWTARDFNQTLDAMKQNDVVLIDAVNTVQLAADEPASTTRRAQ